MKPMIAACQVSLVVLVLAGCSSPPVPGGNSAANMSTQAMSQEQSMGVISGTVSRGPITPNQPSGQPGAAPVPNARVEIATTDGNPVTSAQTDAQGNFRIALPPGTYRVTMPSTRTKSVPATLTISAGEEKHLNIMIDTGLY